MGDIIVLAVLGGVITTLILLIGSVERSKL